MTPLPDGGYSRELLSWCSRWRRNNRSPYSLMTCNGAMATAVTCCVFSFAVPNAPRCCGSAPSLWERLNGTRAAARLYRVLRAKSLASVLHLNPLTEEDLWRMVREMGHLSTPTGARRFANRIYGVTAGNPFYVIELLKTMFAQGLLTVDEESGEWTVSAGAMGDQGREFPVSQTVHDVIAERVERLPEETPRRSRYHCGGWGRVPD